MKLDPMDDAAVYEAVLEVPHAERRPFLQAMGVSPDSLA